MRPAPVCTCLPGATLWLADAREHDAGAELAALLRTGHHRRAEFLPVFPPLPGEDPAGAVRRTGMVAEILARNGVLAVVAGAGPEPSGLAEVRERHRLSGTAFLAPAAGPGPAPTVDALLALLGAHHLVRRT
ncbi:P-loop NTPase family protein [Kitasatospora fiedleri]|uniref:hypothetical protein n=1 Tax=Kitasatospora fiedleri TaxID=2991545 RepID=UPI000C2C39C6|nr:hypothetical protein [Kitasatospora fiedleri]